MARVAKTMKEDLHRTKHKCVGKKMKGFKFADTHKHFYVTDMNKFIGKVGKIKEYCEDNDQFEVLFSNHEIDYIWYYPATKALKHIVKESDIVEKNALEEAIDDTYTAMLKEEIADLSAKLDISYREQEQMLSELNRNVERMKFHCKTVEDETGKLTREDVDYCANLLNRIMRNKFEFKPKNWE
jgi:hypothetical protein